MNLRFEKNHIRFRVTRDELDILLAESSLTETLYLPEEKRFQYQVILDHKNDTMVTYSNDRIKLVLPYKDVLAHKDELPSKEGLTGKIFLEEDKYLDYSFEVDVRKKRKI